MTNHVPLPGCYCADCVEGTPPQPLGWISAEMLNRKREFEANGIVMFDRPCGTAGMPVYAETPSARITGDKDRENPVEGAPYGEGLIGRIDQLEHDLRRIADAEYADHLSGNENFERLQAIARAGMGEA